MAERKRRKLKLLAETINLDEKKATEEEESLKLQTWADLPVELLELILCRLTLEDNVRASAVCRRWHKVAVAVRVVNQSPWLMYFPKYGSLYEFYDPAERKTYSLELPELQGSRACYTKDGWLLLYRPRNHVLLLSLLAHVVLGILSGPLLITRTDCRSLVAFGTKWYSAVECSIVLASLVG
ncbi:hypothetical protein V6Z12_D01G240200 [Gossypium hirsutum]